MESFEHEVTVRYSDMDTYGHVNNAVYATFCEEARVAYLEEVLDVGSIEDVDVVIVSLSLDFRSPVTEHSTVDARVWTTRLGDSSITMAYELEQDGRIVAEAESTIVAIDPATRESRPLPDAWRDRITEYEDLA